MARRDKAKAEQRRAARQQARAVQRAQAARRRRRQVALWSGGAAVLVAVIAWVALANFRPGGPGERVRTLPGGNHIAFGSKGTGYTSNPPTSGPHYQSVAPWGVNNQPLADELLVHNLEHGGIWISYKDQRDTALADRLAAIVRRSRTKVVLTPRPQNDAPIAVAAWGRLLKLQEFDEGKIVEFIDAYYGRLGPEANAPP